MKDTELRARVIDELNFEPGLDAASIGVAVDDGIVTLSGHVPSYAQKLIAERATQRVKGVRAIAQEIEVRYPNDEQVADDQIAERALRVLAWDTTVPHEAVQVKVQKGWVTLSGTVDWFFQKTAAANAVLKLSGVMGVNNMISVRPRISPSDVKQHIEKALRRSAEVDAGGIQVQVRDGQVVLEGAVHSWHERSTAERAAWSVEGVTSVDDRLRVA